MTQPYEANIYPTQERCWKCQGRLVRLDPPYPPDWEYYCVPFDVLPGMNAEDS